ncbi:MAG: bifunctional indole-3-glycerol-phosphate synthase TrpC/phosphoribosylanthranilate isomerase TrpF [Verrucomicrobiota bacterium]|nr:bifunctional indole-3-glycerol-phosphate synthase TrpC/phosphoribosylanthranilate isomerase TrpF [Verrucomicrobiota bacterium]
MKVFLEEILHRRRQQVAQDRAISDPLTLRVQAESARLDQPQHRLWAALTRGNGTHIIAEFKRASPSLGQIRPDADPAKVVALYEAAGACAVSVLTEPEFFQGSLTDLRAARAATNLPILRKDFIIDEYQIDEAAVAGADAILLIVAALTDAELLRFRGRAEDELGLDALVEVHTAEEMQRAARAGASLIGVNNRDLRTFATSLETSVELAALAPVDALLISESGISSRAEIERLSRYRYRGFLIGEALMRAADSAVLMASLRDTSSKNTAIKICGLTNTADALACAELGVEMIGLNFSTRSPRFITSAAAAEIIAAFRPRFPKIKFVGIFVNENLECVRATAANLSLDAIQLHGDETPAYLCELNAPFVIKALTASRSSAAFDYECAAILLDSGTAETPGGTGQTFPWSIASDLRPKINRLILAGGLTSDNVAAAIETVRPFAVDVCSGVEASPGRKDFGKLREFVAAVRAADREENAK